MKPVLLEVSHSIDPAENEIYGYYDDETLLVAAERHLEYVGFQSRRIATEKNPGPIASCSNECNGPFYAVVRLPGGEILTHVIHYPDLGIIKALRQVQTKTDFDGSVTERVILIAESEEKAIADARRQYFDVEEDTD